MLSARDHPICKARTWYTWRFPSRLRAATVREGPDRVFGRSFGRSGLQGKWNGARYRDDHERVKTAGIEISVRRNDKAVGFLISSSSGRLMPALPLGISNASEVEVGPRVRIRLAPPASQVRTSSSWLTSGSHRAACFPEYHWKRGDMRPNLVNAIGPVRRRGSAQAALCSAKKLSGGSASSGVNRGSKRKRVPQ